MKTQKTESKKLSLVQFVWLGFNYTVGIAFIGNLAVLSNYISFEDGVPHLNADSIGFHIVWIFILLGAVASISALAFAKLAKIHKSDNNGGAYLYTRSAFGRFSGFLVVFMQYVTLPFLITSQIFNLLKAFFTGTYAGNTGMDLQAALPKGSEHWSSLILDLIGIVVYFFFAFVVFGGMKLFKKLSNLSSAIKWITSAFLVIGAIYLAAHKDTTSTLTGGGTGWKNISGWFNPNDVLEKAGAKETFHLSMNVFVKAFTSCFFFFAGFETFATAGKNIENPDKNLGRGILIIMLISTVFYVLITLLFLSAVNPYVNADGSSTDPGFIQNMQTGLWTMIGPKWIVYAGVAIMFISQLSLKANVSMQNALYGGTMLQPMAVEGYISTRYNELNKDDLPIKGSILNFMITGVVLVLWLIIPDLVEGITNSDPVFTVSDLTEASSAITLFIYAMVILTLLKYAVQKIIKLSVFEWAMYLVCMILLGFMFVDHYVELFVRIADAVKVHGAADTYMGAVIELIFILASIAFGLIWYFTYYSRIYKKRMSTPEGIKEQIFLNSEFVAVITDWHNEQHEIYSIKQLQTDGSFKRIPVPQIDYPVIVSYPEKEKKTQKES
jgi:amino acid transporter